ncbi:MAG TPA: flagellar hook capping FlgD N-terminal domain-containing protein [Candidatus Acidoferrales bacterium]|jgi:flagellar basal-body rod modification protein FlgD|nr:flagellar hook capping FlgD N-terminal domain-containing protein [Candidatus Acidoferrales bacterium]
MISGVNPYAVPTAQDATTGGTSSTGSSSSSSSSTASATAQSDTSEFISILSAELQSQDPTQPIDPTTFVTQLAQFNSLDELINIRQDIETATGISNPTSGLF